MTEDVFVGRERELASLLQSLRAALSGQGRFCLVMGEAGSGKTALVTEFARRAQRVNDDLVVAMGSCNAQTGVGDPYLPFREILGVLTGDAPTKQAQEAVLPGNARRLHDFLGMSGELLVSFGPDLIGIFVPGVGLAMKTARLVAEKAGWLDRFKKKTDHKPAGPAEATGLQQGHIFEQYTKVVMALAEKRPLLLVLDDLQWADASSISLLFHLARRIGEGRVLILGTSRPEELSIGRDGQRHPLEAVLSEIKRYFGDIGIDLSRTAGAEAREFVDAYLDSEPNRLGYDFRQALYRHTGGHPLFTVELLRSMQERGQLVLDAEGRWVETPALDWGTYPARVEGVIEERMGRLEEELQEIVTVASVEGEEFTAQALARVRNTDWRALTRRLSNELDKKHRLIEELGGRQVGQQRLYMYRFRHSLFQRYLYNRLGQFERELLHGDVGRALEELYGEQAGEIAEQLAWHFSEAGDREKAVAYLLQSGEQDAARYANAEALLDFSRALELLPEDALAERYTLLLAREGVYDLQGAREAQRNDLLTLEQLAEALRDDARRATVALRRAHYAEVTGDYPEALAAAQQASALAQTAGDVALQSAGALQWGRALWRQGECQAARTELERALALARSARLDRLEADSLRNLGIVADEQGDCAAAKVHLEEALHLFREMGNRQGEAVTLNSLGVVADHQSDHAATRACFEQALSIYREIGDRRMEGITVGNLGAISSSLGDYTRASSHLQLALSISREVGDRAGELGTLVNLGLVYHHLGDNETAREHSQRAVLLAQELGERHDQAYAWTFLGHALSGLSRLADAAEAYEQALVLRRQLGQSVLAMEPLAGAMRVSLAQGDAAGARAQAEEILHHLEQQTLDGTEEPFRVYLDCYRVLRDSQDPRAGALLATAHSLLQEQAARIADADMRRSFLDNVLAHRELALEWASRECGHGVCS